MVIAEITVDPGNVCSLIPLAAKKLNGHGPVLWKPEPDRSGLICLP